MKLQEALLLEKKRRVKVKSNAYSKHNHAKGEWGEVVNIWKCGEDQPEGWSIDHKPKAHEYNQDAFLVHIPSIYGYVVVGRSDLDM